MSCTQRNYSRQTKTNYRTKTHSWLFARRNHTGKSAPPWFGRRGEVPLEGCGDE
jgi:hypothetical protein